MLTLSLGRSSLLSKGTGGRWRLDGAKVARRRGCSVREGAERWVDGCAQSEGKLVAWVWCSSREGLVR